MEYEDLDIRNCAQARSARAGILRAKFSIPRMGMGRVWLTRSIRVHRLQSMQEVSHAAPSKPLWSSVKHSLSKPIGLFPRVQHPPPPRKPYGTGTGVGPLWRAPGGHRDRRDSRQWRQWRRTGARGPEQAGCGGRPTESQLEGEAGGGGES